MRFSFKAKVSIILTVFAFLSLSSVYAQLFSSKEFSSAKLYFTQKQFDKAKDFIDKAIEKNPKSADMFYYKALISSELKDLKSQAFAAKTALQLGGLKEAEIKNCNIMIIGAWANTFNAGVAAGNASDVDEAVKQYTLAAEILPDSIQSYYYMFVAQYNSKRYDDALASIEKYIEKGHETQEALQFILNIYYTKARPFKATADSLTSEFSSKKAAYAALKDKKKPPFSNFADSLDAAKANSLANAEYDKGLALLNKYQNSKYIESSWVSVTKIQLYIDSNRENEALNEILENLKVSPNNAILEYNAGVLFLSKLDYDNAIIHFSKAVEQKPDYTDAIYNLGASYLNKGVKIQNELENAYSKEKNKKKKDAIGNDKSFLQYYKLALPNLEKVQEARKNDTRFWYTLAKIYTQLGDKEKAKAAFDNAGK